MVSSSGVYGRPTVVGQNTYGVTETPAGTTPPYLLSTFQVVHNQGGQTTQTPVKATSAPPATTKRPVSKPATVVSTWSSKPDLTTPTTVKRNTTDSASKPTQHTTTKKPVKPVKPLTTTRKPPTKKPVTTATKPTVVKITTQKPTTPTKKPTQPTKKPTVTKPPSTKPTSTRPTNGTRPAVSTATTPKPTTTTSRIITKKPTTVTASTSNRYPVFSTYVDTTSEVVFTKPGFTTAPSQTPGYGITTFRPDLGGPTSKPVSVPSSGLTTFSYVSEGVKVPDGGSPVGGASEAQEENTNIIFQQVGSTLRPGSPTTVTSSKPVDTSVPFFPDAERPGIPTQWIEMIQTSMKPESPYSPPATTTTASTAAQSTTTMAIFEGLNQTDYTQVCGRRIYPQARVVGGEKSTFGKWPWQISLRQWRTSTYLHKCGAALLNENWAITAAHCVENVPPSDLLLRLGEHDLSTEDEPFGFQERRVQIVASHPQFDPRTFEYDLALLRFYEPVKFQPNIIPVCVPEDNTNFVGQTAYVTGWGRLYEDGPLPSVLQEVSVPVINNTLCENMYRSAGYIEHIPEIFICAGWKKGGFDSCEGDSGGPMVIQRPDKRWLLAGVISWGIGCAEPNQPGVYTRISEFREWIHQILQF
ncbi:UNVERIFIED_CONTAM: hypothetical protein PYX00_010062 [Menopon gallinae]|uniref:Peptidase S1 domain-containing protein n=1 Tax=Menopon gallinae TaxID=328185 RepID=A0AAW2HDU3_9NEOP